jgi:hypothetical protein
MNRIHTAVLVGTLALASAGAEAQTARVRAIITGLDGNVLSVKTLDGKEQKVHLADKVEVRYAKAITLADIKPGEFLGTTTIKRADGTHVALEIHVFPADLRGVVNEGQSPTDLQPNATMTNAIVSAMVESTGGRELTLQYKGSSTKVMVPQGIPLVTTVAADRSLLVPGEYVYVIARVEADGKLTAARVQVSKDGVRPPQ